MGASRFRAGTSLQPEIRRRLVSLFEANLSWFAPSRRFCSSDTNGRTVTYGRSRPQCKWRRAIDGFAHLRSQNDQIVRVFLSLQWVIKLVANEIDHKTHRFRAPGCRQQQHHYLRMNELPPYSAKGLQRYSGQQNQSVVISDEAWKGYLRNLGKWVGSRALSNSRGRVLLDLPSRIGAERFRTPSGEDFVLWRTSVRTAEGIDELEEEWSRSELADFGALVADGSFSVGADIFQGEPITIDQCLVDDKFRVRTTHAYDWEGCLSGIVASRERLLPDKPGDGNSNPSARGFVEPVAWRSPRVLFDYMLGLWEGRGVSIDSRTGETQNLTSRLKFTQGTDERVKESSVLRIADGGPSRVFDATAKLDENLLVYPEANVQAFLLPGGIYVSSPIRIRIGRPFAVETSFLMRPDCRKRVIRLYNRDCDWVNTVFINERRVG